ncbi:MAG: FadR family transcriptional regulator [Clostridia bacterium]|nr:FadR family transcriptional regulator [Clostridia bacterium]
MQTQLSSKLLPEQTAEKIKKYIADNNLAVGDRLPNEFQLAEICEVGRSTVREAIKKLIFDGSVEVVRGCGTFITEQKKAEEAIELRQDPFGLQGDSGDIAGRALEFLDARVILEPEVAALAAINATYKDCQKLLEAKRRLEDCVINGKDHLAEDVIFHTQIAACAHNKVLKNLTELLVKGIPIFIEVTRNSVASETLQHHEAIVQAITSGDSVGARCAMITHLDSNRQKIIQAFEQEKGKNKQRDI